MKNIKIIFFHLLFLLICSACTSNDDEMPQLPPEGNIELGMINNSQLVEIPVEIPAGNEFDGKLNGNPMKFVNNHINGLSFWANPNYTIVGETNHIEIPALDIHATFKVKEVTLNGTADAVLEPVFQIIEDESFSELEQLQSFENFRENYISFFEQANEVQKREAALFYLANKDFFDSGLAGKFSETDECLFSATAVALIIANWSSISAGGPAIALFFGGAAFVTLKHAIKTCSDVLELDIKYKTTSLDDVLENIFTFIQNSVLELTPTTEMRGLQKSDVNDENLDISAYFNFVNLVNDFVLEKINAAIHWYNEQLPSIMTAYLHIPLFSVPIPVPEESGVTDEYAWDAGLYEKFSFSVSDQRVSIASAGFSNGNLQIALHRNDGETGDIQTTLDLTYQDEFNEVQESFPILLEVPEEGGQQWSMLTSELTINGETYSPLSDYGVSCYNNKIDIERNFDHPSEYPSVLLIGTNGNLFTEGLIIIPEDLSPYEDPSPYDEYGNWSFGINYYDEDNQIAGIYEAKSVKSENQIGTIEVEILEHKTNAYGEEYVSKLKLKFNGVRLKHATDGVPEGENLLVNGRLTFEQFKP
ncbi:MAG: hypothetical protein WDA08_01975 [Weeksellaceae bacterium]